MFGGIGELVFDFCQWRLVGIFAEAREIGRRLLLTQKPLSRRRLRKSKTSFRFSFISSRDEPTVRDQPHNIRK